MHRRTSSGTLPKSVTLGSACLATISEVDSEPA